MMKAVFALAVLALVGGAAAQAVGAAAAGTPPTLVEAVKADATLAGLAAAIDKINATDATFIDTLNAFNGTVFAPNNASALTAAFVEDATVEDLTKILSYHLVPVVADGAPIKVAGLTDGLVMPTALADEDLTVAVVNDKPTITATGKDAAAASLVEGKTDIDVNDGNAVVHVIDTVLMPAALDPAPAPEPDNLDLLLAAATEAGLTTLVSALGKLPEATQTVLRTGPVTVFGPTDAAFDAKFPDGLDGVEEDALTTVLTYHVVNSTLQLADLTDGLELTTLQGQKLTVEVNGTVVKIVDATGAKATVADPTQVEEAAAGAGATESVLHSIDTVLTPAAEEPVSSAVSSFAGIVTLAASVLAAVLLA